MIDLDELEKHKKATLLFELRTLREQNKIMRGCLEKLSVGCECFDGCECSEITARDALTKCEELGKK